MDIIGWIKNQKQTKNKYSIIAIVTLFLIDIFVVANLFITKNNSQKTSSNKNIPTTVSTPINTPTPTLIPSPTIKLSQEEELLKYVPFNSPTDEKDAYSGEYSTANSFSKDTLFYMAYLNTKKVYDGNNGPKSSFTFCGDDLECPGDSYFYVSDIKQTIKLMYNKNITDTPNKINLGGGNMFYKNISGYEPFYVSYFGAGYYKFEKINKIISYQTNGSVLTIYEKAGFYDEILGNIYSVNLNSSRYLIKTISKDHQEVKDFINNNWNLFKTFKHTFKLRSNGTYYWYSTEVTN